ncbi:MAG TPA: hypothetical protein VH478_01340 [Trebonia sp.]|nr:hypothetical protein [Trebonia sp.]
MEDVYGWVTRAFGRSGVSVNMVELLVAVKVRKKLRWRNELNEAIVAASGGAHSVLELLWDKNVERAHGLPESRKQVPFAKPGGQAGFRDREYVPFGLVIELDGKLAHPGEQRGQDRARDRGGAVQGKQTLRYGWRETRYEACASAAEVARVLWRRGWRGRPVACSPGCPVTGALAELDARLAGTPGWQREWAQQRAAQLPAEKAAADRRDANRAALDAMVARAAQERVLPGPEEGAAR